MRVFGVCLILVCVLALPPAAVAEDINLWPPVESVTSLQATGSLLYPEAVKLARIDGDEHLDAVVVCTYSDTYACLRGNGDGTFGDEFASDYLDINPTDLVVGDFNNDGYPDIAGLNSGCG